MEKYDVVIIGAGVAGYTAAMKCSHYGMKTALIEKNELGGTCVNRGCVPTKALVHISKMYKHMPDSKGTSIDSRSALDYVRRTVSEARIGMQTSLNNVGVDYYKAKAINCNKTYVKITGENQENLSYNKLILATGSRPIMPEQIRDRSVAITTDDLFCEKSLSLERMIILGGGIIGTEIASCLADLGVEITIIEAEDRILKEFSKNTSKRVSIHLQKKGIKIINNASLKEVTEEDGEVYVRIENAAGKSEELLGDKMLVAIGRKPNLCDMDVKELGIEMINGIINTDKHFLTSNSDVYAIGDINGRKQLAYVAERQAEIAVDHIVLGKDDVKTSVIVPTCIYMDMEVAHVGVNADMSQENDSFVTCTLSAKANSMANISGMTDGFCTIIINKQDDTLVGIELFYPNAVDIIGGIAWMIDKRMKLKEIEYLLFPHPSYVEIIKQTVKKYFDEKTGDEF